MCEDPRKIAFCNIRAIFRRWPAWKWLSAQSLPQLPRQVRLRRDNSPERFPITIHRTWILWVFGLRPRIKFIPPQKSSNFHSIKLETNINIAFWLRKIEIYLGFLKNLNIILLFCNLIYSLPFTDYLTTNMEIKKLLIIHKRKKLD